MKGSFCEVLMQYFPSIFEFEELYSTYIANCIFNIFLSHTAIMFNIVTIHALRKTSLLPKTLKTLLLSLAVSDVGVGLIGQPFYISLLVKLLQRSNFTCNNHKILFLITNYFCVASFLGIVAVSVDRFLALHLHLRYQELVTHKRVVVAVVSLWVLSALRPILLLVSYQINALPFAIIGIVCLLLTTITYSKIYLTVRRHKNQIQSLQQVAQTGEMAMASVVKSTVGIFYVYLVFIVSFMPYFICVTATGINGSGIALKRFYLFSMTLVFLNSSLNPVIYCWKMRHIGHAVMDILRNMSWNRNRASL